MESHSQHIPIIKSLYTNQKGKSTFILKMIFVEFFGATISYLFLLKCAFYIDFCIIYVAIISRFYIDNRIFPPSQNTQCLGWSQNSKCGCILCVFLYYCQTKVILLQINLGLFDRKSNLFLFLQFILTYFLSAWQKTTLSTVFFKKNYACEYIYPHSLACIVQTNFFVSALDS